MNRLLNTLQGIPVGIGLFLLFNITLAFSQAFGQTPAQPATESSFNPPATVELVILTTDSGKIVIYPATKTPKHKANFLKLAREGFYDGTTFHRVIPSFMIQGGDANSKDSNPNNDGQGNNGYTLPGEFVPQYYHKRGAVAAARTGDQVNPQRRSSGSQFYIVEGRIFNEEALKKTEQQVQSAYFQYWAQNVYPTLPEGQWLNEVDWRKIQQENPDSLQQLNQKFSEEALAAYGQRVEPFQYTPQMMETYTTEGGAPHLDMQYSVFGEVLQGMEVVDKIVKAETGAANRPLQDIKMEAEVVEMTWDEMVEQYGEPEFK